MKLVQSVVEKETPNTNRIIPYINDQHYYYYSRNSIDPNQRNASCTTPESDDPYYTIIYPYDYFYAENIQITFYSYYRFPTSIIIQGTDDLNHFHDILPPTDEVFCNKTVSGECLVSKAYTFPIPIRLYRGFKILLNGQDSKGTSQLCIGKFEIEGLFVKKPFTCRQSFHLFSKSLLCISIFLI